MLFLSYDSCNLYAPSQVSMATEQVILTGYPSRCGERKLCFTLSVIVVNLKCGTLSSHLATCQDSSLIAMLKLGIDAT